MLSLYLLSIFLLLINLAKTISKDVYNWQRKEYLFYRMKDFLQSKEGLQFAWDDSSWIKAIFLTSLGFVYFILPQQFLEDYAFWILLGFLSLDTFELYYSIKKKVFRYPKPTKKALLITFLTICLLIVPIASLFLLGNFEYSLKNLIIILSSVWLISIASLIFTGLAVLIFYPIDKISKKKIYKTAENHRTGLKNLQTITISGSYGKTTTKEYLYHILSSRFKVEKTEKNQNADLAVARKILSLKPETEIFLCEVGTYRVGLGSQICKMARPTMAIITGLDAQHYNLFGSEDNIIKAESESLDFLSEGQKAYINWDSPMCHKIDFPKEIVIKKYSPQNEDVKDIKIDYPLTSFVYKGAEMEANLHTRGSLENLIGALAIATDLGLSLGEIKESVKNLPSPEGTLIFEKTKYGIIIDDSRNINPTGAKNALEATKQFDKYKKIVIIDEIPELGKMSKQVHQDIAQTIFSCKPELVILQGKSFSGITYDKLVELGLSKNKVFTTDNKETIEKLIKKVQNYLEKNEKVLILAEGYQSRYFLKKLK